MPENRKTVTNEEAQQWFEYFALREDFALGYTRDGCYARAHIMCSLMEAHGLETRKIWVGYDMPGQKRELVNDFCYHVAPCLMISLKYGKETAIVIDPVFFQNPVSPDIWMEGLKGDQYMMTKPGESAGCDEGDGYTWRNRQKEPKKIRDIDAKNTLVEYSQEEQSLPTWVQQIRQTKSLALVPVPNMNGSR